MESRYLRLATRSCWTVWILQRSFSALLRTGPLRCPSPPRGRHPRHPVRTSRTTSRTFGYKNNKAGLSQQLYEVKVTPYRHCRGKCQSWTTRKRCQHWLRLHSEWTSPAEGKKRWKFTRFSIRTIAGEISHRIGDEVANDLLDSVNVDVEDQAPLRNKGFSGHDIQPSLLI